MADTEVEALTKTVLAAQRQPQVFDTKDGRTFAVLPATGDTYKLENITILNKAEVPQPKTVVQSVKMQTAESLEDYVNRFRNTDSLLFADIDQDTIEAIIDYHGAVDKIPDQPLVPRRGDHRATLRLPHSLEWETWVGASGVLKSHRNFATFLEENATDVVSPLGSDLLELCRDLQVIQGVKFGSSVRMGDLTEINYQKDSDATTKGSVALPSSIILRIPVYFGEPTVNITAFMRRRIEDGVLQLGVQLSRAENIRQEDFHRIVDEVRNATLLTTVYGTPA